ncbi:glycerophosphocholine phosphodiesterase GPCPD1-like isoform X4 [Haemaphysalis longicornis]
MDCLYAEEAVLHDLLSAEEGPRTEAPSGVRRALHLRVQADTVHGETVFVCGSSPQLGDWQVSHALEMHLEDPAMKVWGVQVCVPVHQTLEFRYLVGILLENGHIIVRRWETVMHPRSLTANELTIGRDSAIDMFGNYDGEDKVEPGWLTAESVVHLKLFEDAIVMWKRKYKSLPISYRVTPIDLSVRHSDAAQVGEESDQHSNISDFECVKWPVIEIAVMKEGDYEFKKQSQFGNLYVPNDFVIFQAQVMDPSNIAYMVDFYVHRATEEASIPEHVGFSYILPGNLKETFGTCTVPITGNRHQPVGQLQVSYLIVRPLAGYSCNCRETYSKFWKKTNRGLDVGHRGSGNARRTDKVENVLENTVASFNYAAKHDGTWEVDLNFDLNQYVDIILRTLLDCSGKRYIILSCFHPDICIMIRLKQNKYPLLFLTQGQTEKYPPYLDTRTSTVYMATYFALSTHILGINVHTEELLREPSLIAFVKEHKLILFCWGEDNNHAETIASLKQKGVDGVIYDKLDVLIMRGTPSESESVFHMPPGSAAGLLEASHSCCSRVTLPENTVASPAAAQCSVGGS